MTEIGAVRNVNIKDVLAKKYNLYMGISLGNKWFTKEHMRDYIKWGLQYTKERFAIQIAETLNAINYEIQSSYTKSRALKKAISEGDKVKAIIDSLLKELPQEQKDKIAIVRWEDVKNDLYYKVNYEVFQREFELNFEFRDTIKEIVREVIAKAGKKYLDEKITKLSSYVLDEFPELINGFSYNGILYNCWFYPQDGPLSQLVEDIQKKRKFSNIFGQLQLIGKGNGFIELKVPEQKPLYHP